MQAVRQGLRAFIDYPQLWLTIVVAAAIFASYAYVAGSFVGIARDAQDQLINVRIGSLQDAFAPLAGEVYDEPDLLRAYMARMQELNPTIVEFEVAVATGTGQWITAVSTKREQEGARIFGLDYVLGMAQSDPRNSYTIEETGTGVRYFRTLRAVTLPDGTVSGILVTKQTLSQADAKIGESIRRAIIVLAFILLFLLLLFFRHARIIDYAVLYRKLRGVDDLKDEFIAMASHELRAPLTAIRGYIDLLKNPATTGDQQKEWMSRIDISAVALDHLIADMLDVSRIEQGRMTINLAPTDVSALSRDVIEMWQTPAREKGLELQYDLVPALIATVDPDRLRQILVNLISNAVKYTKAGNVSVRSYVEGGRALIRVSDSGIGMTNEERERLFGKFYRAGGEDVRAQRGTGLGLWITKQLIERMDGLITVESIKGVGSHFIVSFPLSAAEKKE